MGAAVITKLPDWKTRLSRYMLAVMHKPFAYGEHDCALLWAGAIEAMTGQDLAAEWRGRYTTRLGGLRHLRKAGHDDHIALVEALFQKMQNPRFAQVGDLAVINTDDGMGSGVITGPFIAALGEAGMQMLPMTQAKRVYRV